MLSRLTRRTTPTVLLGLTVCALAFGSSYLVGEARPLLQTAPTLGVASSFAVLGGSTVTNVPAAGSHVFGDLGVSPGAAITGFPPGIVVAPGAIHAGDAVAAQARLDFFAAYTTMANLPCPNTLSGDLGRPTPLVAGVYCYPATSAQLTGDVTFDGGGNPAALFIIQVGTQLTTASGSRVLLQGSASPCNVYFVVGSLASIGTGSTIRANLLAGTSVTLATGANVTGRALAHTGSVTMDNNQVGSGGCAVGTGLPPAAATAAAVATGAAAATAVAPTNTPAPQSKPPNTPTKTAVPATETAVPTVTRTATAVPPPPTATAVVAATQTPIPPAIAAAEAAAPAAPAAPASAAAPAPAAAPTALASENSTVSTPAGETPASPGGAAPSIPVAQIAPPAQVPTSLPRTGGLPPLGVLSVVLGSLAVAVGVTVRRRTRR